MVATVSTSRDAWANRLMTSTYSPNPSAVAIAAPSSPAATKPQPLYTMRSTAMVAGTSPRAFWEKFTIRLARYTRHIPTATSAPSSPRVTPWR
jgi:hypothetical protein